MILFAPTVLPLRRDHRYESVGCHRNPGPQIWFGDRLVTDQSRSSVYILHVRFATLLGGKHFQTTH